jgi:hypothetical protein
MALGSIQPVTEMSARIFLVVKGGRSVRLNFAAIYQLIFFFLLENVGASTSHNSIVLHGLLQG